MQVTLPPKVMCGRSFVFLHAEGVNGKDIHRRLCNVFGEGNMSQRAVYQWIEQFEAGKKATENLARFGRPHDSFNDETIICVHTLLNEDRYCTVSDIHREMATRFLNDVSCSTIRTSCAHRKVRRMKNERQMGAGGII